MLQDLRRSYFKVVIACGSKVFSVLLSPIFRPAGEKSVTEMVMTTLKVLIARQRQEFLEGIGAYQVVK